MFETQSVLPKNGHHQRQKHCYTIICSKKHQEVKCFVFGLTCFLASEQGLHAASAHTTAIDRPGRGPRYRHIQRHMPCSKHNYSYKRSGSIMLTRPWLGQLLARANNPNHKKKAPLPVDKDFIHWSQVPAWAEMISKSVCLSLVWKLRY